MLTSFFKYSKKEVGCDEAGRGALCGPVVAGAIEIWGKTEVLPLLKDSKKLNSRERKEIFEQIKTDPHINWSVGIVGAEEIDKINILNASILAMHKALDKWNNKISQIIVDGNKFKPYNDIPYKCFVKGDNKYASIAAASIVAKVIRDEIMANLSIEYPEYSWDKNKGYPTKKHIDVFRKLGTNEHYRKSFKLKEKTNPSITQLF